MRGCEHQVVAYEGATADEPRGAGLVGVKAGLPWEVDDVDVVAVVDERVALAAGVAAAVLAQRRLEARAAALRAVARVRVAGRAVVAAPAPELAVGPVLGLTASLVAGLAEEARGALALEAWAAQQHALAALAQVI